MEYATVTHKCCRGCGNEVVTPLTPTDWKLTYDGESISLHPPIGNWNFPCQSHYWIRNSTVKWADQWSREQIEAGGTFDRRAKKEYYTTEYSPPDGEKPVITERAPNGAPRGSLWTRYSELVVALNFLQSGVNPNVDTSLFFSQRPAEKVPGRLVPGGPSVSTILRISLSR
jgi:Family of unknown function (DUF6527)